MRYAKRQKTHLKNILPSLEQLHKINEFHIGCNQFLSYYFNPLDQLYQTNERTDLLLSQELQ